MFTAMILKILSIPARICGPKNFGSDITSYSFSWLSHFKTFELSGPQLVVVSGLFVRCPFTLGSRPQLVVVLGLFVGYLFTLGFWLSRSLCLSRSLFTKLLFPFRNIGYHRAFSRNFTFYFGTSAITEPFHGTFVSLSELRLSRSLFMELLFLFRNFGYHGAYSWNFSSSFGNSAITEHIHKNFLSHIKISAIIEPFQETFLSHFGT
jgi:hypothetical protein